MSAVVDRDDRLGPLGDTMLDIARVHRQCLRVYFGEYNSATQRKNLQRSTPIGHALRNYFVANTNTASPHVIRHSRYMAHGEHEDPVQFSAFGRIKDLNYGIELIETMQAVFEGVLIRRVRHGIRLHKRNRNVLISHCHLYFNTGVGIFLDRVNLHQINIAGSHISYNRLGGIRIEGSEVRNLQITGIVTGECSSAALWPFAACCRRFVTPFSVFLFHPMKWQSDENVNLSEAAEWARHFEKLEESMDCMLAKFLDISVKQLQRWMEPGRYITGPEMAAAGVVELIEIEPGQMQMPPSAQAPRRRTKIASN